MMTILRSVLASVLALFVAFVASLAAAVKSARRHPVFPLASAAVLVLIAVLIDWRAVLAVPVVFGTSLTENPRNAGFLLSESEWTRSRDSVTVTVPANTTLKAGSVLGKITATGKYVLYDNGAADGSEAAAAVLYAQQVNGTGSPVDVVAAVIIRDAEVHDSELTWKNAGDATAGKADLKALGIIARS